VVPSYALRSLIAKGLAVRTPQRKEERLLLGIPNLTLIGRLQQGWLVRRISGPNQNLGKRGSGVWKSMPW
jgi:hypothetical protein